MANTRSFCARLLIALCLVVGCYVIQLQVRTRSPAKTAPMENSKTYQSQPNNEMVNTEKTETKNNTSDDINQWWEPLVSKNLTRVYPVWDMLPQRESFGWCQPEPEGTSKDDAPGFLFAKVPKTGSSSGAGITIRVAHNVAHRLANANGTTNTTTLPCRYEWQHEFVESKRHTLRNRQTSILWSSVRHPARRALSDFFFFHVSKKPQNYTPTVESIKEFMEGSDEKSKQVIYLMQSRIVSNYSPRESPHQNETRRRRLRIPFDRGQAASRRMQELVLESPEFVAHLIGTEIIDYFDFIAVSDRMDESLAVMSLLFGLELQDLVVLPSKVAGNYAKFDFHEPVVICRKIRKPTVTMTETLDKEYFENDFKYGNADYLLYDVANESLERTIQALGKERVDKQVLELQRLQTLALEKCASQAYFPCAPDGSDDPRSLSSCYARDFGCGYACVDRVLREDQTTP